MESLRMLRGGRRRKTGLEVRILDRIVYLRAARIPAKHALSSSKFNSGKTDVSFLTSFMAVKTF